MAGTKVPTDINAILATRVKTKFAYRIDFDSVGDSVGMEEWCKEHCSDIWRAHFQYATYFQFANDTDALMFSLRWGGTKGKAIR